MANSTCLRKRERWQRRDEDDRVLLGSHCSQNVVRDGLGEQVECLVSFALKQLREHDRCKLVRLVACRQTDDGELLAERCGESIDAYGSLCFVVDCVFLAIIGQPGYELANAEENEVRSHLVECSAVPVFFSEAEHRDNDRVVQLFQWLTFEILLGNGERLLLVHG